MAMRSELRGNLIEPLFRTKTWERAPSKRFYDTVHNGGIYQFFFRSIHYIGCSDFTGQKVPPLYSGMQTITVIKIFWRIPTS